MSISIRRLNASDVATAQAVAQVIPMTREDGHTFFSFNS